MTQHPRAKSALVAGLVLVACGNGDGSGSHASSGGVGATGPIEGNGGNPEGLGPVVIPLSGGAAGTGGSGTGGALATGGITIGGLSGSGGVTIVGGISGAGGQGGRVDAGVDGGPIDAGAEGTKDAGASDAPIAPDVAFPSDDAGFAGEGGTHGGDDDAGSADANRDAGFDGGHVCLGITGPSTFPPVSDFAAAGPYAVETVEGGLTCTISRPQDLETSTRLHPVILWGNGTAGSPPVYAPVLEHWASHGFVVAAANTAFAGSGSEMIACLDYLLAQNATGGSPYEGRIDTTRIGASGHSQGGGGAVMAGADPRVTATAPLQPWFGASDITKQSQQNGPMFIMSGSEDTIAVPEFEQKPLFDNSNVATFWGTLDGADHLFSALGDITGYRGPATAWFRLLLMNDVNAAPLFCDPGCTLCADPAWDVQRKGFY